MRAGFESVGSQIVGLAVLDYKEMTIQLQKKYKKVTGVHRSVTDVEQVEDLVDKMQAKILGLLQDTNIGVGLDVRGTPAREQYIK